MSSSINSTSQGRIPVLIFQNLLAKIGIRFLSRDCVAWSNTGRTLHALPPL
jgi:hypothetical protein